MFDAVAKRYDVTNDVLSLGQDRRWRQRVLAAVAPRPCDRVLDLAAGTGTSSEPFATRGAAVVPCDFSLGMLRVGKRARPTLPFVAGDGTRLPFADDTFDAVTISFGLRNIVDPEAGLREMRRVTRPGGRVEAYHTWLKDGTMLRKEEPNEIIIDDGKSRLTLDREQKTAQLSDSRAPFEDYMQTNNLEIILLFMGQDTPFTATESPAEISAPSTVAIRIRPPSAPRSTASRSPAIATRFRPRASA